MPYEFESDVVRPEIQQGQAGQISLFPTQAGQRVETTGMVTFSVLEPGGKSLDSGTVTPGSVVFGSRNVHRLDVPVPALDDPDEDYILQVVWTPTGATIPVVEVVLFDVVVAPLGETVSLSDLNEERPDVEAELAVSLHASLLLIGLITQADDEGRTRLIRSRSSR